MKRLLTILILAGVMLATPSLGHTWRSRGGNHWHGGGYHNYYHNYYRPYYYARPYYSYYRPYYSPYYYAPIYAASYYGGYYPGYYGNTVYVGSGGPSFGFFVGIH